MKHTIVSDWQGWGPELKPVKWEKIHREQFVRVFYKTSEITTDTAAGRELTPTTCALGGSRALRNLLRLRCAKRRVTQSKPPCCLPSRKTLRLASKLKRRYRPVTRRAR